MRTFVVVVRIALVALVALVLLVALTSSEARAGIAFAEGPLEPVLAQAKREQKRVLVEVWAAWCKPCERQRAEVFDTPAGDALAKGLLAWRVDFDAPEMRPLMERWAVMQLPTILVLRPDGSEVDRIVGYQTRDAFLVEAQRLVRGEDTLPTLQKRVLLAKNAHERLCLQVEVAHKQLVRVNDAGGPQQALASLERIATDPGTAPCAADRGSPAEESLYFTGRWLSRVKRDHSHARHVWRELAMRFPEGKYARTADWWYAGALHEAGLDDVATVFLARRAREKPDADTLDNVVGFAVETSGDRKSAQVVVEQLAKTGRIPADEIARQRARLASPP